jgi:ankyrin repeat protein
LVALALLAGCAGEKGTKSNAPGPKTPAPNEHSKFGFDFVADILKALGGELSRDPVAADEKVPFPEADEITPAAARLHVLAKAATTRGDRDFFIYLQNHPDVIDEVDATGQGLAHKLVHHDLVGPLKLLATKNYRGLSQKDDWGRYPLHYAVSREMVEAVWDLELFDSLDHSMSPKSPKFRSQDLDGETPFHRLVRFGNAEAVGFVVNKSCSLMMALPNMPWVHESDDLEIKDKKGMTPLHLAAIRGDLGVTQALLNCWLLDGSYTDNDGNTALHYAQACGHKETAALLISSGKVPVSTRNVSGRIYTEEENCPRAE